MALSDAEQLLDAADVIIRELDELDGDSDFEPSLGAPNPNIPSVESHAPEPAISTGITQEQWSHGPGDDREDEHDGREPDDERGLGVL